MHPSLMQGNLIRNINGLPDMATAVNQEKNHARKPSDIYLRIELVKINIRVCFTLIYCKNNEIAWSGIQPSSRVPFVSRNVNNFAHVDGLLNALSVIFTNCNFANMERLHNVVSQRL